jgi:hypothetical protein
VTSKYWQAIAYFFENQGTPGHFGVSNLNQDKICGVSE